ncbi:hypothetical protein AAD018_016945 [Aestuariibius insulae]|uniref:hypothetical protein n=1 Tax=Aestuariibius insulae TaxID=2058287 RepID=UPI00345E2B1F
MPPQTRRIVIIGGFPRAGTRQFCNLVNHVPGCRIQGEMDPTSYKMLAQFVQTVDENYVGRRMEKGYAKRRNEAVIEAYRLFSKTSRNDKVDWGDLKVVGLKKPLIERSYQDTKALFGPSNRSVTHFYCLRNIYSNFNSLAGAFDYTIPHYKTRLSASISGLQKMVEDDFFDIRPLHLDGFVTSDGPQWVQEKLYAPIGLEQSREEASLAIEQTTGSNRTPDQKRRPGITASEAGELKSDKDFIAKIRWLEEYFDISLM